MLNRELKNKSLVSPLVMGLVMGTSLVHQGCGQARLDFFKTTTTVVSPPDRRAPEPRPSSTPSTTPAPIPTVLVTQIAPAPTVTVTATPAPIASVAPAPGLPANTFDTLGYTHFDRSCAVRTLDYRLAPHFSDIPVERYASIGSSCTSLYTEHSQAFAPFSAPSYADSIRIRAFERNSYGSPSSRTSADYRMALAGSIWGQGTLYYSLFENNGAILDHLANTELKCNLIQKYSNVARTVEEIFRVLADRRSNNGSSLCLSAPCQTERTRNLIDLNNRYQGALGQLLSDVRFMRNTIASPGMCNPNGSVGARCSNWFDSNTCNLYCARQSGTMCTADHRSTQSCIERFGVTSCNQMCNPRYSFQQLDLANRLDQSIRVLTEEVNAFEFPIQVANAIEEAPNSCQRYGIIMPSGEEVR